MQRPDTDENDEKQKNRGAERKKHSLREGPSLKVRMFAQSSFGTIAIGEFLVNAVAVLVTHDGLGRDESDEPPLSA
jgi:hypothetical protein